MKNAAGIANLARAEEAFWWDRGMRRILFRLLDPLVYAQPFTRALEAGCGAGHFAKIVAERYGLPVIAVDLGWEGLQHGRRRGVPWLAQADLATLPFRAATFDLVLSMDVIAHFPKGEEDRPVAEFARVLQRGGWLAIRVSALDALRSRHSECARERQRFTRTRLVDLLERHGLRVQRCTYANSLLLPLALARFRLWEPLLRQPSASGVRPVAPWLDRLLTGPLALESHILGAGLDLPIGQSLIALAEKE